MGTRMLQRRGTAAEWAAANPVLGDGEIGYNRSGEIRIGDGTTAWNSLPVSKIFISKALADANYVDRNLVDSAGDLLVGSADNTVVRLAKGADGQYLTVRNGALQWQDPSANTVVDAAGDLLMGAGPDIVTKLAKGANGQVLSIVGGLPAWVTLAAAGPYVSGTVKLTVATTAPTSPAVNDLWVNSS